MNPNTNTQLAIEKMQSDFTFFNELTKRLGELRNTDMSDSKVKAAGIEKLVMEHTGMKIKFGIHKSSMVNAYMMPPSLDRNHPFWNSRGYSWPVEPGPLKKLGVTKEKTVEVWCDESNYTVGGGWSKVEIELMILKGLMKLKTVSDAGIAAIFLHELGHAYTYFSLFGKLTLKNFLTSEAIKDLLGTPEHDKRVQVLEKLSKDLDIDIKNKEKLAHADGKIQGDLVESIVITETAVKPATTSANFGFDTRNIEQIADQFALYHGAGPALSEAMVEMYRSFGMPEAKSNLTFVIFEVIKVLFMAYIAVHAPLVGVVLLLLSIPGDKIYDDPEARVELMRKQVVESLRNYKDQPEMTARLMAQLEEMEKLKGALKDRRTFFTLVYQTITPHGRRMYRQEVFMKSVENLLYNDVYFNAAKFGALANEN